MAVRHAEQAVAPEPFRETTYQRLIRDHATAGNRAEAHDARERHAAGRHGNEGSPLRVPQQRFRTSRPGALSDRRAMVRRLR
jgi:hypothetical protein